MCEELGFPDPVQVEKRKKENEEENKVREQEGLPPREFDPTMSCGMIFRECLSESADKYGTKPKCNEFCESRDLCTNEDMWFLERDYHMTGGEIAKLCLYQSSCFKFFNKCTRGFAWKDDGADPNEAPVECFAFCN